MGMTNICMAAPNGQKVQKPRRVAHKVVVNGITLKKRRIRQLEATYGTKIRPGRYWYDSMSGLWGYEGGPTVGQTAPGEKIGRLSPRASNGNTGIFINGRELHQLEYIYLVRTYGAQNVLRGRFWMNAQGVGGYEGGPPIFNLATAWRRNRGGSTYSRYGSVIGDGSTVGYFGHDGTTVTCGPDGGCLY